MTSSKVEHFQHHLQVTDYHHLRSKAFKHLNVYYKDVRIRMMGKTVKRIFMSKVADFLHAHTCTFSNGVENVLLLFSLLHVPKH